MVKDKSIQVHPTSLSFHDMLSKARGHARNCIDDTVKYHKNRWDKTHQSDILLLTGRPVSTTSSIQSQFDLKTMSVQSQSNLNPISIQSQGFA